MEKEIEEDSRLLGEYTILDSMEREAQMPALVADLARNVREKYCTYCFAPGKHDSNSWAACGEQCVGSTSTKQTS